MSKIEICCNKLEKNIGFFDILGKQIDISTDDSTGACLDEVLFCPFCGRRLEFIKSTKGETQGGKN